jgi:hypothetical protein
MQASKRTRPLHVRSVTYACCHGAVDFRNIEVKAKAPQAGRRRTKKDLGESVKTGCTASILVHELDHPYHGVSAVYLSEEKHSNHPKLNKSQVSG